jgi:hypothetical protein
MGPMTKGLFKAQERRSRKDFVRKTATKGTNTDSDCDAAFSVSKIACDQKIYTKVKDKEPCD